MMIKNSFKQMFRQPVKVVIFFLLMAASTMLLVFGAAMYAQNTARIMAVEDLFTTVATVEQPWVNVSYSIKSDPCLGDVTVKEVDYGEYIYPEDLDFPGAGYEIKPESRPYCISYMPDMSSQNRPEESCDIVEITLLEDPPEDGPVRAEVTKVLYSDMCLRYTPSGWSTSRLKEGTVVSFCMHGCQENPLKKGGTYVTSLAYSYCPQHGDEFAPCVSPHSTQYNNCGNLLDSAVFSDAVQNGECYVDEVTPGFYDQGERGQLWLNLAESMEMSQKSFPVLATSSLDLLPSYRKNMMELKRGRFITSEEFESGAMVCMVTNDFAIKNLLYEGDKVSMSMLCSFYGYEKDATQYYNFLDDCSALDANGGIYAPFWDAEYEIVGMFAPEYGAEEIGFTDMFIIPRQSVKASDEANIAYYGPMTEWTAAFQIPNGSIAQFDMALREAVPDVEYLDISYSDMGYERTIDSLNNIRRMAFLLFVIGLLACAAIIALLLLFFIVREKRRTAIERSLGLSRSQCRISLMAAVMALTVAATATGTAFSRVLLESTDSFVPVSVDVSGDDTASLDRWGMGGVYNFSAKYSIWAMWDAKGSLAVLQDITAPDSIYLAAPTVLWALVFIAAAVMIGRNMKIEPLLLLGSKE